MKLSRIFLITWSVPLAFFLGGCMSAKQHYEDTHGPQERQMTVGTVQKEIKKGMSGAEVAEVLGSPNIVTTDAEGREVWIYDKVSTDVTYSRSSGGGIIGLLIGGVSGDVLAGGGAGGSFSKSAGAESTTQNKMVRDFAYHSSKF